MRAQIYFATAFSYEGRFAFFNLGKLWFGFDLRQIIPMAFEADWQRDIEEIL
jgi:hypothetical protein